MGRKNRRAAARVTALTEYAVATAEVEAQTDDQVDPAESIFWSGVIGMEKTMTGDGRMIEDGALEWSTPIPLRYVEEDSGGHMGAVVVGRILSIERGEGGEIFAQGDFDLGSERGREAARLVREDLLTGVSMDLDSVAFEVRIAKEMYEQLNEQIEIVSEDEEGSEHATETPEPETDEEGRVVVVKMGADDEVMVTTGARIRAATMVSVPAFAEATISIAEEMPEEIKALVASAAPVEPPESWFHLAEPDAPTALTITDEGQVYGHLATWETCHVAAPAGEGVCVMAPKSPSNYAYFHTGSVKTAEGTLVPTGILRFNTKHASLKLSAQDAAAHYDHTGLAGADVHAVDGKHGIWVSGALRPGLSEKDIRTLRASPLSGDWRYIQGKLELVGALAVNQPGFPVPRTQGLVASGELHGIVAVGMIAPENAVAEGMSLSSSDARYLQRIIDREKTREQRELRARVDSTRSRMKIAQLASKRKIAQLSSMTTQTQTL